MTRREWEDTRRKRIPAYVVPDYVLAALWYAQYDPPSRWRRWWAWLTL